MNQINKEQLLQRAVKFSSTKLSSFETIILAALKAKSDECLELDYQASEQLKKAYESAAVRINLKEFYK